MHLFEQQTKRLLAEYKAKYFTAQKQIAKEEGNYKVSRQSLARACSHALQAMDEVNQGLRAMMAAKKSAKQPAPRVLTQDMDAVVGVCCALSECSNCH